MKTKHTFAILTILSISLFISISQAQNLVTATNSGNWSDTNIWDSGTVPGTNDAIDIEAPLNVIVDTNEVIQFIVGGGTVTMGANATLDVLTDTSISSATTLDTSAIGNTVIYSGNAFFSKIQNYYNLVLNGVGNFYNGDIGNGSVAVTVVGNMTLDGQANVVEGDDITIDGDLIIGTNSTWDCSLANLTADGNTTINGIMVDNDGAAGADTFNSITIDPSGTLNILDSTNWFVNGNLTNNNGTITGKGYANINFNGAGIITGSPISIPTLAVNGTYSIGTTVTVTTNTPSLNGTLVFDLANPGKMVVLPELGQQFYYNGNLDVIDTGAAPESGDSYQLFSATGYNAPYTFATITLPTLASGLTWVDSLTTNGSIAVTGTSAGGSPIITVFQYDPITRQFTLTWTSEADATYTVQSSTNLLSGFTPLVTDIPSGGGTTTATVAMPNGDTGFLRIVQQ